MEKLTKSIIKLASEYSKTKQKASDADIEELVKVNNIVYDAVEHIRKYLLDISIQLDQKEKNKKVQNLKLKGY